MKEEGLGRCSLYKHMVIFVTTGFFVRTDGLAFQLQFLVEWLIPEGGANTDCTD